LKVNCLGRNNPSLLRIEHLYDLIKSARPDFIFCPMAQANYGFLSEMVNLNLDIPIVLWNGTDDEDFPFASTLAPKVALYCSSSNRWANKYKELGANAIFLPFAADENVFFKDKVYPEYESELCYVGMPFGNKTELLLPLEKEYKCCFKWGAELPQTEVAKVYNSARIALQPATHQDLVAPGMAGCSHATFEVPATGTLLLQRDRPDLWLLYEEDELATFDGSFPDLKEKIDYYLEHKKERQEMAEKAYNRTVREHLYKHRFNKVLRELGFEN